MTAASSFSHTHGDLILVVGHGSREEAGNQEVRDFVAQWRLRHPDWRIECGFIEFGRPALDAALLEAGRQAARVIVLPLILNAAGHMRGDIPEAVAQARRQCPDTLFLTALYLSACQPVLQVLQQG